MTATEQRASGFDSNARGLAVLAVAVVVGLLLLLNAGDGGGGGGVAANGAGPDTTIDTSDLSGPDATDDTQSTDGTDASVDETTTSATTQTVDTRPPAEVKVLVLNGCGSTCPGVARTTSDTIGEKGYVMQQAANASAGLSATTIYFNDGYQADAEAVAAVLGKAPDTVEPMPSTVPGPGADSANVVVVLGADTPPASASDTTAN